MKKRFRKISLLLVFTLWVTCLPTATMDVEAAQTITVNEDQTIENQTITGDEGSAAVIVKSGKTLTLKNVTINAAHGQSAIYIEGSGTLVIEGIVNVNGGDGYVSFSSNVYTSYSGGAGIEVPSGSAVTIKGSGTLNVTGGDASDGTPGTMPSEPGSKDYGSIGKGGGGAGAGIGSRGASTSGSTPQAGTITINDDNLRIVAKGGEGGIGGSGSDGGRYSQLFYDEKNISVPILWYSTDVYATRQGGYGGNGGGGGGYPAAGIGSGGAAGGDGGAGGIPAQDYGEGMAIFNGFAYIVDEDVLIAAGGGGGGGGQGYVSGGGGGAGETHVAEISVRAGGGSVSEVYHPNREPLITYGTGGASGNAATDPSDEPAFNGVTGTNAKGGTAGIGSTSPGNGGVAGIGQDSERKASSGNNGKMAGNKGNGGTVILSGGVVTAKGGEGAQDIGSGGGNGANSGTLRITGGQLYVEKTDNIVQPVNAKGKKLYGAIIYPSITTGLSNSMTTDVTINGSTQTMRFGDASNGHMCVWLEESNDPYNITVSYPTTTEFIVTVKNGTVDVKNPTVVVNQINIYNTTLVIWGNQWFTIGTSVTQAYNRDVFASEGIDIFAYTGTTGPSRGNITENTTFELYCYDPSANQYPPVYEYYTYEGGVLLASDGRDYNFIIDQSTYIRDMYLGHANDFSGGTVTIETLGSATIKAMSMMNNNGMTIEFTGDENSSLTIGDYAGTSWEWDEPSPITNASGSKLFGTITTRYPVAGAVYNNEYSLSKQEGTNSDADIMMNSEGKVTINRIVSGFKRGSGAFSGTPQIEVNKGRLAISSMTFDQTYYDSGKSAGESGDLTVNGGTFIKSGDAYTKAPTALQNIISGTVKVSAGASILSADVQLDEQLTSSSTARVISISGLPANQHLTKIAKSSDPNVGLGDFSNADIWTDGNGTYTTVVTPSDAGKKLYFEDANGNPYYYYVDKDLDGSMSFKQNSFSQISETFPSNATANSHIDIYEKFWVYDDQIYKFNYVGGDNAIVKEIRTYNRNTTYPIPDITLHDQVNIRIDVGTGISFIGKNKTIDGDGSVMIYGSGITTEGINIKTNSVDLRNGVYTLASLDCDDIKINYASVKMTDGSPIVGATNLDGNAVYLTKILQSDMKSGQYRVFENSSGILSRTELAHQNDAYYYIYVTKDSKTIGQSGGTLGSNNNTYLLTFNEEEQIMDVVADDRETYRARIARIDITKSNLEILNMKSLENQRYFFFKYDGGFYRKEDYDYPDDLLKNYFEIGNTNNINPQIIKNRIIINTTRPVTILLDNITMETDLSCIELGENTDVTLVLRGTNKLTSKNEAAIRVPESATLKIKAYVNSGTGLVDGGILNATGGLYAAAIGGNQNEVAGTIHLESGTYSLTGMGNPAIGSGAGEETSANSIIVASASVQATNSNGDSAFGTALTNAEKENLSPLVLLNGLGDASITMNDTELDVVNDNGLDYVYVPTISGNQTATVVANEQSYMVQALNLKEVANGQVQIYQNVGDKTVQVQNGDLILEGSVLTVNVSPNDGYGMEGGLSQGTYVVKKYDDGLYLVSTKTFSDQLVINDAWTPQNSTASIQTAGAVRMMRESLASNTLAARSTSSLQSLSLTLENDENVLQVASGLEKGKASATLTASGSGVTAELIVGNTTLASWKLTDIQSTYTYQWDQYYGDTVSIRFKGTGNVVVSGVMAANELPITQLYSTFGETYTVTWGELNNVGEDGHLLFSVELQDKDGNTVIDRNPASEGIQVAKGSTVVLVFLGNQSDSILDGFDITWEDGTKETLNQNRSEIKLTQDVTIDVRSHLAPEYIVEIPKEVTIVESEDEKTEIEITASNIKNMLEGDSLNVLISGLDEEGNAVLTRQYATDTLLVPVQDAQGNAIGNNGVVATFEDNALEPTAGGKIVFGELKGDKKAGTYTGKLTFTFSYKSILEEGAE